MTKYDIMCRNQNDFECNNPYKKLKNQLYIIKKLVAYKKYGTISYT